MKIRFIIFVSAITVSLSGCITIQEQPRKKEISTTTTTTLATNNSTNAMELAQLYVTRGNESATKRDFYTAKQYFIKAAKLNPGDYRIWGMAGSAAKSNADFAEAIEYFRKVIELNPDDYRAYGHIGNINAKLKKYDEAISAFEKALSLNDTDLGAASGLSDIYYEMGDFNKCEQYMKRFESILSEKNTNLLSTSTKDSVEKSLNRFANYRTVIKGKAINNPTDSDK